VFFVYSKESLKLLSGKNEKKKRSEDGKRGQLDLWGRSIIPTKADSSTLIGETIIKVNVIVGLMIWNICVQVAKRI